MYSTCLHCNKPLGTNDVLETLPIGRRIAFDPAQGRLWVVCRHCAKWNLVPFDTRLESIGECERLYRDTAKRYSTGKIGLARARDGLDLVRIGEALRPEFASWRYGESYKRRRRNALIAGGAAVGLAGVTVATLSVGLGITSFAFTMGGWHFVEKAWGVGLRRKAAFRIADPELQKHIRRVDHAQLKAARLVWQEGQMSLEVPRMMATRSDGPPMRWQGPEVLTVGRRVTGGLNLTAGTTYNIEQATSLIARHKGDLAHWLRRRVDDGFINVQTRETVEHPKPWGTWLPGQWLALHELPDDQRLGVEMWMNEDIERVWLEGELKLLEREWREAEKIAKIADDLVLPESVTGDG